MRVEDFLRGSVLPRLEAEVLTSAALGQDRSWLLAHGDTEVSSSERTAIQSHFRRRTLGEPVAYITGTKEFYGRTFHVSPAVLIPRPSTEQLVDLALRFLSHPQQESLEADTQIVVSSLILRSSLVPSVVVDVGTGSGCIAVTMALEASKYCYIATDASEQALDVARSNAKRHGVDQKMTFRFGNDLEPIRDLAEPFVVVTNPPYIPLGEKLPREVADFEPSGALFADDAGMAVLKRVLRQANQHPFCAGIVFECRTEQYSALLQTGSK